MSTWGKASLQITLDCDMNEIQILLCQGFIEIVGCLLWQLIHLLHSLFYCISVTKHYPSVLVKSCIFFINECKAVWEFEEV